MAQSALTVTTPDPTPPTNFSSTGASPPNPPNYTANTYNDPKNWSSVNPKDFPPPFYDDGTAGALTTFAANTAALASGSGGTAGGTPGSYPGVANGVVPASTSQAHEGAGAEVVTTSTSTNPGPYGQLQVFGINPPTYTTAPNQTHPSTLSPAYANNPTLSSIAPTTAVSGATGTDTITATGVGFTKQSVVYKDGVAQPTTFVSSTSITAAVRKSTSAGTAQITVVTGGAVITTNKPLTYS